VAKSNYNVAYNNPVFIYTLYRIMKENIVLCKVITKTTVVRKKYRKRTHEKKL
jgi:hypothetical protein